ncbi:MAG TPA: DinB family protein [Thermoanaerobaculia bacterium]|nr:DinB family protein [Thermoanaerobaculia bacterium]
MRRAFGGLCLLALAVLAAPAMAQEKQTPSVTPPVAQAQAPAASGVRAEILRQIGDAQEKLVALAEAMPADKYGWRPGAGVRSTGEVFLHVAGGNYFLPTLWGVKPPEGVDVRGLEKQGGDKAKVIDTLKKSFDHARQAIQSVPEADLEKAARIFGQDGTNREAFMVVASHAHEHLGQAIAYARMNGVTPPWSAGG